MRARPFEMVFPAAPPDPAEMALFKAASEGDLATLTRLLEEGVNLEATVNGYNALMVAARCGKLDCLEYLIAKGASLNAQDSVKMTAMHLAADEGHTPCVESLLEAGADASLKDIDGLTASDHQSERRELLAQED
uniref:Uncharacterized protein n=1 Tax=Phaeocystis antarctica TaxID=33657 RepID=A0A7S0NC41_9EUKA